MPSFPTSVWAPTSKSAGQVINAAHVNDAQDEIVAIEGGYINGTAPITSSNASVTSLNVSGNSTIGGALLCSSGVRVSGSTSSFGSSVTMTAGLMVSSGVVNFSSMTFINDNANANMTRGFTINQGAADDEILALKSSDIAHGITDETETDTYGLLKKGSGANGILQVEGLSAVSRAIDFVGVATSADATKSNAGYGSVNVFGYIKSGTGKGSVGANGNLFAVADQATTRFILDADGDSHQDVGTAWTNFDSVDDTLALNALALYISPEGDPYTRQIREAFGSALEAMIPREALERMKLVTFNPDGHHFVNMSKLAMLHTGAIRQLADRCHRLLARVEYLTGEVETLRKQLPEGRG